MLFLSSLTAALDFLFDRMFAFLYNETSNGTDGHICQLELSKQSELLHASTSLPPSFEL